MTKDIKLLPTQVGEMASSSMIRRIYAEGSGSAVEFHLAPCSQDDQDRQAFQLSCRTGPLAPETSSSLAPAARGVTDRTSRPERGTQ